MPSKPPTRPDPQDEKSEEEETSEEQQSEEVEDEEEEEEEEEESESEEQQQNNQENATPYTPLNNHKKQPITQNSLKSDGESASESDTTLNSPSASDFTIKPIQQKSPPKPERKRPIETPKNASLSTKAKKAKATNEEDGTTGKDIKSAGRLWSDDDIVSILKGMVDYFDEKGADPYADMSAFHEFIRGKLHVDVSKYQMTEKIRRLKKKFMTTVEKYGEDAVFSNPFEVKTFELSKMIWGKKSNPRANGLVDESAAKNKNEKAGKENGLKVKKSAEVGSMEMEKRDDVVRMEDGIDVVVSTKKKKKAKKDERQVVVLKDKEEQGKKQDVVVMHERVLKDEEERGKKQDVVALHEREENKSREIVMDDVKELENESDRGPFSLEDYPFLSKALDGSSERDFGIEKKILKDNVNLIGRDKARELEEKWRDVKVKEVEIFRKRLELQVEMTKLILDAMKR